MPPIPSARRPSHGRKQPTRIYGLVAELLMAASALCAAGGFTSAVAFERRAAYPPQLCAHEGSGGLAWVQGTNSALAFTHVYLFFQREKGGAARPTQPLQENASQNCMRVRERMRELGTYSLFGVVVLAVLFYGLMMSFAARAIPPAVKWWLSPALAAIAVALIVSYYEGGQLADVCAGESRAFRLDIFMETALKGFILTLIIFGLWSLTVWRRGAKRLQTAVE
jgi:hypothetical protein